MSWCRWGKWQQGGRGGQGAGGRAADLCRASGELMQVGQVVRRYGYHCIRGQVGGPAPGLSASLPLCLSDSLTLCLLPPVYSHVPLPLPPTCCLSLYVPCVHACKWLCLHTQGCMCACVHMFVCMRACVRACVCVCVRACVRACVRHTDVRVCLCVPARTSWAVMREQSASLTTS